MEEPLHSDADSGGAVLRRVNDAYHLIARLYEEVDGAARDAARRHLDNATREIAAVQRLYERRGREE